jgi:PEP-CTERM/exosortase A-associated glycosyltransferase
MKILHCFDHSIPLHSGYSFRSLSILGAQRRLGWETVHVTSTKHVLKGPTPEVIDGWEFHRSPRTFLDKIPILQQAEVTRSMAGKVAEVARQVRPDIIHAHSPSLIGWAGQKAAKKLDIPFVYEIRAFWEDAAVDMGKSKEGDLRYKASRLIESRLVRAADRVGSICAGLHADLLGRGTPASKLFSIPNAIDPAQFLPLGEPDGDLQKKLGFAASDVILGYVGSFYAYEGLDLLVRAVPQLKARIPDFKLLLVGGGPEDQKLRALVAELNVANSVVFTGRVSHDEVSRYSSLPKAFIFPRKKMRLTDLVTPLKPLEAMAHKKLVIASDVGGHRELIKDGHNGFLFQSDSIDSLVACAERVLGMDKAQASKVLDTGRTFVENERNWDVVVKNYIPVYESLSAKK